MSHPHILTGLTEREAITDAVHRALAGLDSDDLALIKTAFAGQDVSFAMDGDTTDGLDAIVAKLLAIVGPLATQHILSNVRIDVKAGAETAYLTAYAQNMHAPGGGAAKQPDGPKFESGSEYFVDLVKDTSDGLWKIKKWVVKTIWFQGDPAVLGKKA